MIVKDPVDNAGLTVPLAMFQELVAQYHHRLLSLEAELKELAKSGGLEPRGFARRVKRLKSVHQRLAELQRLCLAETPDKLTSLDIGLPLLDVCTPEEHRVCAAFLAEQEAKLARLVAETGRVQRSVAAVAAGEAGPVRLVLLRSRLRRLTVALDARVAAMHAADEALTVHVDKLLASVGGAARDASWTTLDGLIALYQKLDATISRIARLRVAVKKEGERTGAMTAWLRREQAELAAAGAKMAPPTPLAVTLATAEAGGAAASEAHPEARRRRRRQRLLAQFWDEVVHQGLRAPDTATALAEASMLLSRARAAGAKSMEKDA